MLTPNPPRGDARSHVTPEGIRSLFETATGGQDKFFRVFIAYQDNETGYIISYDNSALNLSNFTVNDAVNELPSYGISLWRQNRKDAQRPPVYGHIPHSLLKESWELKIHPAYHMAVRMQAMGNKISPDAYIASLEKQTDRLFSSNAPLQKLSA